jgi:hypothetical protein
MLEFLGEQAAATALRAACESPVTGTTTAIGDEIVKRVKASI